MTSFDITGDSIPDPKVVAVSEIASILRGEISATEAYRQVLEKLAADPEVRRLEKFLREHQEAVDYWTAQLSDEGFDPEVSSGFWGRAVEAFVATAQVLGNTLAVSALREGELHGLKIYRDMLNSRQVSATQKSHIRSVLLPIQEAHVQRLEGFKLPSSH
jgi:hypothetical protein